MASRRRADAQQITYAQCDEDPAALWAELVEALKTLAMAAHHAAVAIERTPDDEKPNVFPRYLYIGLSNDARQVIDHLRHSAGHAIDDVGRRRLKW